MKFSTLLLAGLVLTVGISTAAIAGHHEGDHGKWFTKVDTDSDGSISKAEFMAKHEMKFNKMDADSDGMISMKEHEAGKGKMKKMKDH